MSVNENYLKANDFILLSTAPEQYYVLRVTDAEPIVIDYFPQTQISGFLPMNAFTGSAVSGQYNSYIVDREELAMQEFTNITNFLDSDTVNMVNTNYLLQIFMGIAPSPLRVFRYYPSNDAFGNYLAGNQIHWGGRQKKYDIGYVDGFMSPKNDPTYEGEFFMPPTASMLFTFVNSCSIPIYPEIKFYINQMVVEPVHDTTLAVKILDRIVPARRASAGTFDNGFTPDEKIYGVDPVPLTATTTQLKGAGY